MVTPPKEDEHVIEVEDADPTTDEWPPEQDEGRVTDNAEPLSDDDEDHALVGYESDSSVSEEVDARNRIWAQPIGET